MPALHKTSVRSRILWEYAKLSASSRLSIAYNRVEELDSVSRHEFWSLTTSTFKKLDVGAIKPSAVLKENKLLMNQSHECAYCGATGQLHWEHIIPLSRGGPDNIDNIVLACPPCNLSKGAADVIDWCKSRSIPMPRIVMGKYLKLLLKAHESKGSLDWPSYPPNRPLKLSRCSQVFQDLVKADDS